jgi:hypothetical protein
MINLKVNVLDLREGDVVKYINWKQVVSITETHAPEYKASYRTLYFEDGTNEIFNIYERLDRS